MKPIKTTIIGGLIFLIPFGILLLVFGKVLAVMRKLAEPLDAMIPYDAVGEFAVVDILAVVILLLVCYLAGLVASRAWARKFYKKFDERLLDLFPRYSVVKSLTKSLGADTEGALKPVFVQFDDLAQVAFEVERGPGDLVTVFLPGSPDPWSGSVAQITSDRVKELGGDFPPVVKNLRNFGRGTVTLLSEDASS